jgi:hypothetical protein
MESGKINAFSGELPRVLSANLPHHTYNSIDTLSLNNVRTIIRLKLRKDSC